MNEPAAPRRAGARGRAQGSQPAFDFAAAAEADDADTGDAGDATLVDDGTLTVTELNDRIGNALRAAFRQRVWVRGEIQGLGRPSAAGHLYFNLVDTASGRHHVDAVVRITLFSRTREAVERLLKRTGDLRLSEGMEVRIEGSVEYHGPSGQLSLRMTGIDPAHTLGRMALDRDRLLRQLASEGLLERNGQLPMPLVPLRVGLVASTGTAGYNDVLAHLEASGLAWQLIVSDARVQGASASRSVARAIRRVGVAGVDVIVVIRGGGSRSDLAVFDAEPIARAIADAPVPVVTGVGHEIDTSVADAVAHTSCTTPTACAASLVARVRAFQAGTEEAWDAVLRLAGGTLATTAEDLDGRARRLAVDTRRAVELAEQRVLHAGRTVRRGGSSSLASADRRVEHAATRVSTAAVGTLRHADAQVGRADDAVRRAAPRHLATAAAALELAEARIRSHDPALLLARGWSLTTTDDGRLVRSATDVAPGSRVRTTLRDGQLTSRVEDVATAAPPTESATEVEP